MAKLLHGLIAQRVLMDRVTNSVSYIDMVDGFNVQQLPVQLPPFAAGTLWERTEPGTQLQVRMAFVGPDDQVIGTSVEVPPQEFAGNRHRVNVNFQGMPISAAGEYAIRIEQKRGSEWVEDARIPLTVSYVPPRPQFVIQQDGQNVPLGR